MRRRIRLFLAIAMLAACSGGERPTNPGATGTSNQPTLATVSVSLSAPSIAVGQTAQASAILTDANGGTFVVQGDSVTWSSSSSAIATVSTSGVVTAVSPGSVTITASILSKSGSTTLTVSPPPTQVAAGVPVALLILTQPSSAAASGTPFSQQPVLQLQDASGNPVSAAGVQVSASLRSGGTLIGVAQTTTLANGTATFRNLGILGAPNSLTLDFSAPTLTGVTSSAISLAASPVTDEPVYDSTSQTMRMQDNMDQYTTLTAMGAALPGSTPRIVPNPSPIAVTLPVDATRNSIIRGRGATGNALRMSFPGGPSQASAVFYTINTTVAPATATHYFQYYARVDFGGPLLSTVAVKWFEAWHLSLDRVQWNTHDHLPCPSALAQTYWQVYDQGHPSSCQGNQPVGPYPSNINDAQWHRYTYSYKENSAPGARDGFARMWVDGVKVIDISAATMGVIPPGGEKPWCLADDIDALASNDPIHHVEWGSTQTTNTGPWTYDIDDFFWWTSP